MASSSAVTPVDIPGFDRLSATTSVHRPTGHEKLTSDGALPGAMLIILCSWFGAATKHIAKYTAGYQTLYPAATILLCQSTPSSMFFGADLSAAADIVTAHRGPVVIHAYSNGGSKSAIQLAQTVTGADTTTTFSGLILDCCPGTADLNSAVAAIGYAVPAASRGVGRFFVRAVLFVYMIIFVSLGLENDIAWIRRQLNQAALFPPKQRLYLFSDADELVRPSDVRSHAADARAHGVHVREEVFTTAPHCGLMMEDAERYWAAVQNYMRAAVISS